MFVFQDFDEEKLTLARESIFFDNGFYVFRNFINDSVLDSLKDFWLNKKIIYHFHDKLSNKEVSKSSPPYSIIGSNPTDITYCTGIWNDPIDCLTHEIAIKVAILRNLINGLPIYESINFSSEWLLQYRVCRTCSNSVAVRRHRDFIEEFRNDPTGSHEYDPSRLQATLLLSTEGIDYESGGFYLETLGQSLSTAQMNAKSGDLILWRYNLPHGVKNTKISSNQIGFLRIIYPLFQIGDNNV